MRLKLTHVIGPKKHVTREQEEHEVDECMQEHRLLKCALQVVTCTEVLHESATDSAGQDGQCEALQCPRY